MEWLWAPWRMPYIRETAKTEAPTECFFCDDLRTPADDRRNLVLVRGRACFALLNKYPYTGGHLLIAPKAHKADLDLLKPAERAELMELTVRMEGLLKRTLKPHGFNLGINLGRPAGAGVPGHVHIHIVPRWNGDTNFMNAVGNVKVIPQGLLDLYDELQSALPRRR
jgi:ATP adenylyltransferase